MWTWEERCELIKYLYPIVDGCGGVPFDMRKVYPIKQREVKKIYEFLKTQESVEQAYIFGSSISMKCTQRSDTDIGIRLRPEFNYTEIRSYLRSHIHDYCPHDCDILWINDLKPSEKIYENIMKGVQII